MKIECKNCTKKYPSYSEEIYDHFMLNHLGTRNDQVGSKLSFYCRKCAGIICTECLRIPDEILNDLSKLEYQELQCPVCDSKILSVRMDCVSADEAVNYLYRFWENDSPADTVRSVIIQPNNISNIRFNIKGFLLPDEGVSYNVIHKGKEYVLFYFRNQVPYSVFNDGKENIRLMADQFLRKDDFTITADNNRFCVMNKSKEEIFVENSGRVSLKKTEFCIDADAETIPLNIGVPRKEIFERMLKKLSDLKIWDFMLINEDITKNKKEIHIAGSTDLIYYHIVELYFKKVSYSNIIGYFHHPSFRLADPVLEYQFRDFSGIEDEEQTIFEIITDNGGFNENRYFISAKHLFIEYKKSNI